MSLHARRNDSSASATTNNASSSNPNLRVWSQKTRRRRRGSSSSANVVVAFFQRFLSGASAEKATIGLLLIIAWGWIMVTIGMLFFHRIYRPESVAHGSNNQLVQDIESVAAAAKLKDEKSNKKQQKQHDASPLGLEPGASPLLLFTYQRSDYLRTTLEHLLQHIPHDCSMGCPLVISQDGTNEDVSGVIREFGPKFAEVNVPLEHWQHEQAKTQLRGSLARISGSKAYAALALHYRWALDKLFASPPSQQQPYAQVEPKRVLIMEEDLRIAPDFFSYFSAMAPILDRDSTLLAVSAYNDNGLEGKAQNTTRLLRSDFFPGLGWMMTRKLWTLELSSKWPQAYWDDWLREPAQRQGRHIIRPEVSRTYHFGVKGGASNNQYGAKLSNIWLNPTAVDWEQEDQSHEFEYLLPSVFDREYWNVIKSAAVVSGPREADSIAGDVRMEYDGIEQFKRLARKLDIFAEEKAGVPRTAYKGVVETRCKNGRILFLTPPLDQLQKDLGQ